jgi:hypothetical protein
MEKGEIIHDHDDSYLVGTKKDLIRIIKDMPFNDPLNWAELDNYELYTNYLAEKTTWNDSEIVLIGGYSLDVFVANIGYSEDDDATAIEDAVNAYFKDRFIGDDALIAIEIK